MRTLVLVLLAALTLSAAEHRGTVVFNGLPLPGATVTATQGDKKLVAIADPDGKYFFPDLADGTWNFDVEMLCFTPVKQDVTISTAATGMDIPAFDLKLLPLDQIKTFAAPPPPPDPARISVTSQTQTPAATPTPTAAAKPAKGKKGAPPPVAPGQNSFQRAAVNANPNAAPPAAAQSAASDAIPANSSFNQSPTELNKSASDGLLINGTVNNGASTPYAQSAAFGNNRRGAGSLYNGSLGVIVDNSSLDAQNFSYTGQNTPKPGYDKFQGIGNFGGPIRIPHLIQNGPIFFVAYNWTRNHTASVSPSLVPTEAQRTGDLSAFSPVYDPTNGAPFPGNIIPANRISPQATALLNFYPQPNFNSSLYNYQIPIVGETHQDSMQTRLNKNIGNKNQLYGTFAFQRTAVDAPNMFGFLDKTSTLGSSTQLNWSHRMSQRMFAHFQLTFSRMSTTLLPNFANKENVSGEAGINGNAQDPLNWGPPTLQFTSIASLTDGTAAVNHNQTIAYTYDGLWNYGRHNITYGADLKRQEFNSISQQTPRGTFTFTGADTAPPGVTGVLGNDFADFLLGTPDTAKLAFGNADKYFRSTLYDGWVNDDWRVGPALTLLAGVRWEYASPITELYGRLVNLDVAPGYSAVAPVVANSPTGSLTGIKYPDSLIHPDKTGLGPKLGLAWRPIPASSLVVRAGYGVYYNTSIYQSIATQMAQQAPLSKSLSIQNMPTTPLTLANGFNAGSALSSDIFGIDPNFRVGYAQNWQVSVQRDLPGSLVITGTYLGIKGTRGPQEFLPNTYPAGGTNPCLSCPSGFIYETSNGNSTRESGRIQLRRRLRAGFTSSIDYTFSKSIDDSALGGGVGGASVSSVIAQNWLNLSGEKGLSNFDQRHVVAFQLQYTTGQGLGGGTLLSGWRGTAFKEWTVVSTINAGTGLPLNPFILAPEGTTGVTGSVRPDYTGAPLYSNLPPGYAVNPLAFVQAPTGQFGNAGRNTITGPDQFTMNASLRRTFRLKDRYSLDVNVDATNVLNHVTFSAYNVLVNSPQFGLPSPTAINGMRVLQTTVRVRF